MIKIIGLGNELRGDDGIGPEVLQALTADSRSGEWQLIHAGSDAFLLLDHLQGDDPVIVIDCARMGRKPGDVERIKVNDNNLKSAGEHISLHGFGFAELYRMARHIGPVAPCTIIAVEPESVEFNTGISAEVRKSIDKIITLVIEETQKNAEEDINH